jgi:hypothetical protein
MPVFSNHKNITPDRGFSFPKFFSTRKKNLNVRQNIFSAFFLIRTTKVIFRFDCLIQERSTYDELMSALNTEDHRHCFELNVIKLDVLCLGVSNVIKLLSKLDHKVMQRLFLTGHRSQVFGKNRSTETDP